MRRKLSALALAGALLLVPLAKAEITQEGNLRVAFEGKISPRSLPRQGAAPISVSVGGHVATTDGSQPPALITLQVAINRNGHLDSKGLPSCKLTDIQPSTTKAALIACKEALVGEGSFSAAVAIPEQSPFPSQGKLLAFNGTKGGKPVIFAHVYGTEPLPTSFTLALKVSKSKGTYGTLLSARLPEVAANIAFVTEISLKLNRRFHYQGKARGYLEAGCPAPKGFPGAVFSLVRSTFGFADGRELSTGVLQECRARGEVGGWSFGAVVQ